MQKKEKKKTHCYLHAGVYKKVDVNNFNILLFAPAHVLQVNNKACE